MFLYEWLHVEKGVTSVVGSGGKTSLLSTLARELPGSVVLTTTTHIMPFAGMPLVTGDKREVARALSQHRIVCAGTPVDADMSRETVIPGDADVPSGAGVTNVTGKLSAPIGGPEALADLADYVLVEADGSKRLPLKAHAAWEPVIPALSTQTILVVGASGFGQPVCEVAHRVDRFCELAGCEPHDIATPRLIARVLCAEGLADRMLINQVDSNTRLAAARELAESIATLRPLPIAATSLKSGWWEAL